MNASAGALDLHRRALIISLRSFNLRRARLPLLKELQGRGWEVLAAGSSQPEHDAALACAGIPFAAVEFYRRGWSVSRDAASIREIARLIRDFRPTVIHVFNPKPTAMTAAASLVSRNRALQLCTVTGMGTEVGRGIRSTLSTRGYRALLARFDHVIFENEVQRDLLVGHSAAARSRSSVCIASGVDITKFRPAAVDQALKPPLRIGFASRLLWSKGIRELLEVAERLRGDFGNAVSVDIAGEPERGHRDAVPLEILEAADRRGTIRFVGQVPLEQMPEFLRSLNIVVLPSYREGFSKTLMEGAATGCALVASDIPGCREVVINGMTGIRVPPRDATALHDALRRLIEDRGMIASLGRNARALAEAEFDDRVIARRTADTYDAVLRRKTHRSAVDR